MKRPANGPKKKTVVDVAVEIVIAALLRRGQHEEDRRQARASARTLCQAGPPLTEGGGTR
jgi:hypothetical protein